MSSEQIKAQHVVDLVDSSNHRKLGVFVDQLHFEDSFVEVAAAWSSSVLEERQKCKVKKRAFNNLLFVII